MASDRINLLVLEGDGIGPEITQATVDVLCHVDGLFGLGLDAVHGDRSRRRRDRVLHVLGHGLWRRPFRAQWRHAGGGRCVHRDGGAAFDAIGRHRLAAT